MGGCRWHSPALAAWSAVSAHTDPLFQSLDPLHQWLELLPKQRRERRRLVRLPGTGTGAWRRLHLEVDKAGESCGNGSPGEAQFSPERPQDPTGDAVRFGDEPQ